MSHRFMHRAVRRTTTALVTAALSFSVPASAQQLQRVASRSPEPASGEVRIDQFLRDFAGGYASAVIQGSAVRDAIAPAQRGQPAALPADIPPILETMFARRQGRPSANQPASDPKAHLDSLATLWATLSPRAQAYAAGNYHVAIVRDLAAAVDHGELLDESAAYVSQILRTADESWYVGFQGKTARGARLMAEGEKYGDRLHYRDELTQEFHNGRAQLYTLLGKVALKRGDKATARRELELAFNEDHTYPRYGVAQQLLDLTEQSDPKAALRYAGNAYLLFPRGEGDRKINPEQAKLLDRLDRLYAQTHPKGGAEGKERYLDSLYAHDFPLFGGVKPTPYTGPHGGRTVLLTTMTCVDCGSCRRRDDSYDAMFERYGQKDVIIMVNHYATPYVTPGASGGASGGSDLVERLLMTDPFPHEDISKGTCDFIHINGVWPPIFTPQTLAPFGNATAPLSTYDLALPWIDKELAKPALAKMELSGKRTGGVVSATLHVDSVAASEHPLKVQIVLVEDSTRFDGANHVRIWRMIPRRFAGDSASGFGFPIPAARNGTFTASFDIATVEAEFKAKNEALDARFRAREGRALDAREQAIVDKAYKIDPKHLSLVAFIHDAKTGEVLHTVFVPVGDDWKQLARGK